ncbi:MAG: linear amide C-N hydrolase, partial [bacterium]|nr:linear amide C-N hydrolase [bacterium]
MKVNRFFIILVLIIIVFPHISPACTTFCFKNNGDWIYGRNYDWHTGHCLVMVNKRGVSKVALRDHNPAKWVSKYGSITFNQYGREFPLGGMNEAGLVIECMWLNGSKYPPPDSRAALSELQWIQYQLDNYAAVEDVIKSDKIIRIDVSDSSPLHFLVCDRNGQAATIEFLDGKMKVHTKETLPASALTNHTYEDSILLWKIAGGNEGSEAVKRANYSLKRFFWAARGVDKWNREKRGSPVDYAFNVLGRAAV